MKLPTIKFSLNDSKSHGVEIIDLDSIYKRLSSLDHDPGSPHRLDFYILIYITQGSGSHFIDFNHYPIQAGNFVFINKNQIHAFDLEKKPSGKVVFFTQDFADEISVGLRVPMFSLDYLLNAYSPVLTINQSLKETSDALLLEVEKEFNDPYSDDFITQLLFSSLLLKLVRERHQNSKIEVNDRKILKITRLLKLIEENFTVSRNASFYADKMGISYKSLNQICKQYSNQTVKQLIDTHIILAAKRSLVIEKIPIKEIAYDLGFDEITNFIKYFKKHTLVTPAQFKINHQG